ncbi:hypothetical protein J3F84DRAFT_215174 [Trichoderma pleuroticola]
MQRYEGAGVAQKGKPCGGFSFFFFPHFPVLLFFPLLSASVFRSSRLVSQHGGVKERWSLSKAAKARQASPPVGLAGVAPSAWLRYTCAVASRV